MAYMVFESGCGKWVKTDGVAITYTSNRSEATQFSEMLLAAANSFYHDFSIYKRTMRAVPVGSNIMPSLSGTVTEAVDKWLALRECQVPG